MRLDWLECSESGRRLKCWRVEDGFKLMSSDLPVFETAAHEALAVAVMQQLNGKAISIPLKEEQQKQAQNLASAFRRGDKASVFRLSGEFYPHVMPLQLVGHAYFRVHDEPVESNPNFQIAMDCLKENHAQSRPDKITAMPLEDALLMLLLALTYSDKNSIYYSRIDEITGKVRPTTFPLTEKLIKDFLSPFGELVQLQKRVLVIQKGMVMGNPAGQVAWLYGQRKRAYEEQKKAYEQQRALAEEARRNTPKIVADPLIKKKQEVKLFSADFDNLLKGTSDADEKKAHQYAFQGDQLKRMIEAASEPKIDFKQRLEELYAEKIPRQKANLMAMKLSIKLKRMMTSMGTWDHEIWREFQDKMQGLGIWDGSDWLAKWDAKRTGKQHLTREGKDYLIKEKPQTVDDLLSQSNKIQDKLRGQKMLGGPETPPDWLKQRQPNTTPEQRKVLEALAREERLEDLIELSFEPEAWDAVDASIKARIYRIFATYSYTDMAIIKELLLKSVAPELVEEAKRVILELELNYNKIANLFEHDFKLVFAQAIDILFEQKAEQAEKDRLNSAEYQRSPAAQYGKYQR